MKTLASVLLLVVATLPLSAKWKEKEKRFDPVRITNVQQVEGRYVGIDPDYVVDLRLDADGRTISGSMTQFGVTSPLRDLRINGAELTATLGGLPVHGTFVRRVRNSATSFGLLVHDADVRIDALTLSQIFCRRQ